MNYSVVYDSTRTNLWWWLTWSPATVLGLLFIWLILRGLRSLPHRPTKQRLLLLLLLVLVCAGGVWRLGFCYYVSRHFYLYYGPYTTIEGVVKNYRVFRTTSSIGEQFEVNGIRFGYIDSFQWKCFHKAAANGGPIHEGLPVRISYATRQYGTCIVKLEVAEEKH